MLVADEAALGRFVAWCREQAGARRLSILFTPWGEAVTRRWYRDAMVELSHLPHVRRVAVQTNLSRSPDWTAAARPGVLALWATYHPGEVDRAAFLGRCARLRELGVDHSVGIVGRRDHVAEAEALRADLPGDTYLWVNAEDGRLLMSRRERDRWLAIDPRFGDSAALHGIDGACCAAGHDAIAVDGHGDVRRCHFTPEPLGNLYDGTFGLHERPTPCPEPVCECHIGYVHVPRLGLRDVYADHLLERIPTPAARRFPQPLSGSARHPQTSGQRSDGASAEPHESGGSGVGGVWKRTSSSPRPTSDLAR